VREQIAALAGLGVDDVRLDHVDLLLDLLGVIHRVGRGGSGHQRAIREQPDHHDREERRDEGRKRFAR